MKSWLIDLTRTPARLGLAVFLLFVLCGLLDAYVVHPEGFTLSRPPYIFLIAVVAGVLLAPMLHLAKRSRSKKVGVDDFLLLAAFLFLIKLFRVTPQRLGRDLLLDAAVAVLVSALGIGIWRAIQDSREATS